MNAVAAQLDITPITSALMQLLGAVIMGFGTWAVGRFVQWLGLKNSEQIAANIDDALRKAVTYGLQQAQDEIRAKGWDHVDVRNKALQQALPYMINHFPDTLKAAGLDLNNQDQTAKLVERALDRAFPEAARQAAESPATPPATAPKPDRVADLVGTPGVKLDVKEK